ncbi:hypothetical protein HDV03_003983 [Kappamyces sp. JEL0829]|nr:hypothetical protein HDV03_003983 [Kappamyces sp. JEL0829]
MLAPDAIETTPEAAINSRDSSSKRVEKASRYLKSHDIPFYLQDALYLLLLSGTEAKKSQYQFLQDYFEKTARGEQVVGRDFQYLQATEWNKESFVAKLAFLLRDDLYNPAEIHQIAELICGDFPYDAVQDVALWLAARSDSLPHTELAKLDCTPVDSLPFTKLLLPYLRHRDVFGAIRATVQADQNGATAEGVSRTMLLVQPLIQSCRLGGKYNPDEWVARVNRVLATAPRGLEQAAIYCTVWSLLTE